MSVSSEKGPDVYVAPVRQEPVPWTTEKLLKQQLLRLWERGELLRPQAVGDTRFPLRLSLKSPNSRDLTARFETVRTWVTQMKALSYVRIDWREVRHPVMGTQRLPRALWIDSLDAAAAWLGKRAQITRFMELLADTRQRQPLLLSWLARNPLQAIELADRWSQLLNIVEWIGQHPRPAIYLRQVDIPGIHSKFIEAHRNVLSELLDLALPVDAIAEEHGGASRFAARYGFLDKPLRIRFRVLDKRISPLPGPSLPDLTLDADSFARLDLPVRRVFITENEINFLAFPPTPEAVVVFGKGYGWEALAQARWLSRCALYYWGDIDTHGFAILDQLRSKFSHVTSFLMDRRTLMAHENLWGQEAKQVVHDLPRLTASERALYNELRDNRIRRGLRLEQEQVGYRWLQAALEAMKHTEKT